MEIITILLKDLLLKAEKNNRAVYLKVLKTNIKAQNLYQRLGFVVKEEIETHIKIIYKKF
ncbi:MAG: GNAT family N-acetyltransferase [Promethearchaeota archaeon]